MVAKVGGIGAKLLQKFGWEQGQGLGINEDGLKEPIRPTRTRTEKTQGIGSKTSANDNWLEDLMKNAYGAPDSTSTGPIDLLKACEGRRCKPHGTAKLARLDAHEKQFDKSNANQFVENSDSDSDSDSDKDRGMETAKDEDGTKTDEEMESDASKKDSNYQLQDGLLKAQKRISKTKTKKKSGIRGKGKKKNKSRQGDPPP